MHWAQVTAGVLVLGVAFGVLFIPTFGSIINVCILGSRSAPLSSFSHEITNFATCDHEVAKITNGMFPTVLFRIFLGLFIPGVWLLFTGLQSRSLIGMKKEA